MTPGPLPADLDERPVAWSDWEVLLPIICGKARAKLGADDPCGTCGAPAARLRVAHGTVTPYTADQQHTRTGARMLSEPAHPIKRLLAFGCTACGGVQVLDRGWQGDAWREVPAGQPGLFPIEDVSGGA